jgi:eukaryotic-like serine/threonine-protein kinase
MMTAAACPECGEAIAADAPMGVCPRCLLRPMVGPDLTEVHAPPAEAFQANPTSAGGPAPVLPDLEILGRIGQGGMGTVYKARQIRLDRLVAVKVIRPDLAFEPAFADRFRREARAMARLNHPNIVTLHDSGEAAGVFYLVMEFVDGGDLRRALGRGPLTVEAALGVALQVSDALQSAHDQGVIHRDIKPENVLRDRRGRVKIADFGLAKLLELPAGESSMTATRQFLGTPAYVAPEQFTGVGKVDHRADIYALGVLLYEMLTDRLPLGRYDLPSEIVGTDEELDEILARALQGDPSRRQASVGELRTELATYAEDNGLEVAMPPAEASPIAPASAEVAKLTGAKDQAEGCAGWVLVFLVASAFSGLAARFGFSWDRLWLSLAIALVVLAVGFGLGFWSAVRLEWDWRAERRKRQTPGDTEGASVEKPRTPDGSSTLGPPS